MYDYWLGGKDNFAVDRDMAERAQAALPQIPELARANRRFAVRAVRVLAERGVTQFIDLGTGLPTSPNVHEVAGRIHPDARVVYVDNDPMVVAHNRTLDLGGTVTAIRADVRDPDAILTDAEVRGLIDFDRPVGLLLIAVLQYLDPADDVPDLLRRYRAALAAGSHLVVSAPSIEEADTTVARRGRAVFDRSSIRARSWTRPEVEDLLDGFDLVDPGLVPVTGWRADEPDLDVSILGAVGRVREPL